MAVVEEHPMFKVVEEASKRQRTRQDFYEALKGKYPANHPLVKSAKKAVDDAAKEMADVIDKL
jgi:hypothetical protein